MTAQTLPEVTLPQRAESRLDRLSIVRLGEGGWRLSWARPTEERAVSTVYLVRGQGRLTGGGDPVDVSEGRLVVIEESAGRRLDVAAGGEALLVRIPDVMLGVYASTVRAATASPIDAARGTAGIVGHLLRALAADAGELHAENPARLAQHIAGLIALMCADATRAAPRDERTAALLEVKEYIEDNLADYALSPDRIAAAKNMSTRTLHRLFEAEGHTIAGWIRARRLENCRTELSDPHLVSIPVSGIGARWGLWDAAHFSRLFKTAFGVSPRAYRLMHAGHSCDGACAAPGRTA